MAPQMQILKTRHRGVSKRILVCPGFGEVGSLDSAVHSAAAGLSLVFIRLLVLTLAAVIGEQNRHRYDRNGSRK